MTTLFIYIFGFMCVYILYCMFHTVTMHCRAIISQSSILLLLLLFLFGLYKNPLKHNEVLSHMTSACVSVCVLFAVDTH